MTAQDLNFSNFFETTADGNIGASDTSITLSAAPTSGDGSAIAGPFYLVIDPDTAAKREIVLVNSISGVTCDVTGTRDIGNRHDPDISHADGVTIRMAVVGEMFQDVNDRVSTIINSDGTAVNTTLFLDEDTMTSDSATKGATQQSIKAYVDNNTISADSTATLTNKTIDANGTGNSISNIEVADLAADAVVLESEGISSNDNDTSIPTSAAVKDYVDTNATSAAYSIVDTFASNADIASPSDITNIVDEPEGYGGNMSVSSGVFTFPETGYWLVEGFWHWTMPENAGLDCIIQTTTNNSSYSTVANGQMGTGSSVEGSKTVYVNYIFDVTDTSTHKVKFRSAGTFNTYSRNRANGTKEETWFRFSKVADT